MANKSGSIGAVSAAGLVGVAKARGEQFVKRVGRFYEQGVDAVRIGQ